MYFESFNALIEMGGHKLYVWSCYGLTLALLVYNVAGPMLTKKHFMKEQRRLLKRKQLKPSQQLGEQRGEQG